MMQTPPHHSDHDALCALLGTTSSSEFFAHYWDRKPLLIAGTPNRFTALFDRSAFARSVSRCEHLKASYIDAEGMPREVSIEPAAVAASLSRGATVCASVIMQDAALRAFLESYAASIHHPGEPVFNAYCSPDGAGFGLHLDDHPVWIVQIDGAKRWWYCADPVPNTTSSITFAPGVAVVDAPGIGPLARPEEDEFVEVVLEPGDVLYLPQGTWHRASAIGLSLALTLARTPASAMDLAKHTATTVVAQYPTLLRNLPGVWVDALAKDPARTALDSALDASAHALDGVATSLDRRGLDAAWSALCEKPFAQTFVSVPQSKPVNKDQHAQSDWSRLPFPCGPTLSRAKSIARAGKVDAAQFANDHLGGEGMPLVVIDQMDHWVAKTKWSFEFFREQFADDKIIANSPMFLENDLGLAPVQMEMRLADYIDYVLNPRTKPVGDYLRGSQMALTKNGIPLYDPAYRIFSLHPELSTDLISSPYYVDDLFAELPRPAQRFLDQASSPVHFLFFAPPGGVSFLHADYWQTHAYLAQLAGLKLCVMFAPSDSESLYHGAIKNPLNPDLSRFPKFADATPYATLLSPGETLFIPSGWQHFVLTLEPAITYSYDFFTRSNMQSYFANLLATFADAIVGQQTMPDRVRGSIEVLQRELHEHLATQSQAGVPTRR